MGTFKRKGHSRQVWKRLQTAGRRAENKVPDAFKNFSAGWFKSLKRGSDKDDNDGIDFWIETNLVSKPIALQIKSNYNDAQKARIKRPGISVVVVRVSDSDSDVRQKVYRAVTDFVKSSSSPS